MLFNAVPLDPLELEVIRRIEEVRKNLSYAISSRRWQGALARMTLARAIRGSNSIEGYNVSVDDAMAIVANEEPLDTETETKAALFGYRTAMTYVLQLADDPHFSFSRGLIRSLHYMMLAYDLAKHPGLWRPGPIYVRNEETREVVYEGPPAETLNDKMRELVNSLNINTETHVLIRAAMAHLNLVMIHPFSDGNGRMGRVIQTLVLARGGVLSPVFCSIEEYLGGHREEYYKVLSEVGAGSWHPERDAAEWIHFCLTAHFRQASTLVWRARIISRLWDELEIKAKEYEFPDRVMPVLSEASMGLRVRNAVYRREAEISENLAGRDFKSLVDAKFLVPKGERRGRYYQGSESLQAIFRKVFEPYTEADPFDGSKGYLPGMAPALDL